MPRPSVRENESPPRVLRCCAGLLLVAAGCLFGCDLVPSKPEAVFALYRDRMKTGQIQEARTLLSEESKKLAADLESTYKLNQPPEDLALLNALDPVTPALPVEVTDTVALLRVRTLKGGQSIVRLTRKDSGSRWAVDLERDLNSFRSFLEARHALETMREQAGEYATTWKAFSDRIDSMKSIEHPPQQQIKPKETTRRERRGPMRRRERPRN